MNPASYLVAQLEENHRMIYLLLLVMFIIFVVIDVKARNQTPKVVLPEELTDETKASDSNTSAKKKNTVIDTKDSVLIKKSD